MDFDELQGLAISNAINNMIAVLMDDNNDIYNLNDITMDRIYAEIDSLDLKFDEYGNIL